MTRTQYFQGKVAAEVESFATGGGSSTSGNLSLSKLTGDSHVVSAVLYASNWTYGGQNLPNPPTPDAHFNGVDLGITVADSSETIPSDRFSVYSWDVTSLVSGDGQYSASASGLIDCYGAVLVVVYSDPGLRSGMVVVQEGAHDLNAESLPGPSSESANLEGIVADNYDLYLHMTDDPPGPQPSQISFNGEPQDLGNNNYLIHAIVGANNGSNIVDVTATSDWLGWDVSVLSPSQEEVDLPQTVEAGTNPYAAVAGWPDGTPVTFNIFKNGLQVGQTQTTVRDDAAIAEVDTSSSINSPGDAYYVEAKVASTDHRSPVCTVVPGPPSQITTSLSKGLLVADGHDSLTVTAMVRDRYGNPVEDGTNVEFGIDEDLSDLVPSDLTDDGSSSTLEAATTQGGVASYLLTAPLETGAPSPTIGGPLPDDLPPIQAFGMGVALHVTADPVQVDVAVPAVDATGALAAGQPSLDVYSRQTTPVTLWTNASEGTPVFWTVSNYAEGTPNTFETTVSGGSSSINLQSAGCRLGPTIVTATIGSLICTTNVEFTSSAPLSVQFDRVVLDGGAVQDGTTQLTLYGAPIFGQPAQPVRVATVPAYATATATLRGAPYQAYSVALRDASDNNYVTLLGLDSDGTVTTDSAGMATFQVQGNGTFQGTDAQYLKAVALAITPVFAGGQGPGQAVAEAKPLDAVQDEVDEKIYLTRPGFFGTTWDGVQSFFGGDPNTAAGMAANVAGGMLIVGDIGSLVKNGWRQVGFSSKPVNYVEASLSGLGLLTELAVGAGEVADAPISGIRSLSAFLGKSKFTELLDVFVRKAVSNAQDLGKLTKFVSTCLTRTVFTQASNICFLSEKALSYAIRNVDTYGDNFVDAIEAITTSTVVHVGSKAIRGASEVLATIRPAVKEAILNAPDASVAIQSLIRAVEAGIDPAVIKSILRNTELFAPGVTFPTKYLPTDLFKDLDAVSQVADKAGMARLVNLLKKRGDGRWGWRYELEVAAEMVRTQGATSINFISRNVAGTDIDIAVNGVYYQVKRSRDAFKKPYVDKIDEWLAKAKAAGGTQFGYIAPGPQSIPAAALAHLNKFGIMPMYIGFK